MVSTWYATQCWNGLILDKLSRVTTEAATKDVP